MKCQDKDIKRYLSCMDVMLRVGKISKFYSYNCLESHYSIESRIFADIKALCIDAAYVGKLSHCYNVGEEIATGELAVSSKTSEESIKDFVGSKSKVVGRVSGVVNVGSGRKCALTVAAILREREEMAKFRRGQEGIALEKCGKENSIVIDVPVLEFVDALQGLLVWAGVDEHRQNLSGVNIENQGEGMLRLVATNGHCLSVKTVGVVGRNKKFPRFLLPMRCCKDVVAAYTTQQEGFLRMWVCLDSSLKHCIGVEFRGRSTIVANKKGRELLVSSYVKKSPSLASKHRSMYNLHHKNALSLKKKIDAMPKGALSYANIVWCMCREEHYPAFEKILPAGSPSCEARFSIRDAMAILGKTCRDDCSIQQKSLLMTLSKGEIKVVNSSIEYSGFVGCFAGEVEGSLNKIRLNWKHFVDAINSKGLKNVTSKASISFYPYPDLGKMQAMIVKITCHGRDVIILSYNEL